MKHAPRPPLPYRPCVVGVFCDTRGRVLVCERGDQRGQWQLPQGGVERGESVRDALLREMAEELGTAEFEIVAEAKESVCYDFPQELQAPITKNYRGQRQHWFKLNFRDHATPDLQKADGEFVAWQWLEIDELLKIIVNWKREAYYAGFKALKLWKG